jgi:hypothetical protein
MKIDLFDRYDIRARICALIFVVSPFLLDAYILVDAVRNVSFTVIITAVLIASSGLFPPGSVILEIAFVDATI